MATLTSGQNLPTPQVKFVDASGNLTQDGYKFFINQLNLLAQSIPTASVTNVAAAGATQATATQLSDQWNNVSSQKNGGTGVLLSAYEAGQTQIVYNSLGVSINVYPQAGSQINALGVNQPYTLASNTRASFLFFSGTQILT